MKKNIITLLVLALSTVAVAQEKDKAGFGIGTKRISKAAMLDIQAKNKGVLLPRIELSAEDHKLNGGTNPEGVIVYNTGSVLEHGFYYWTGAKWEKVAANSQIIEKLTELQTTLETQIKEITIIDGGTGEGGTETDISYLVSYSPESHVFTYLFPKEGGGYDKKEIDFKTAIKEEETNTFIREVKSKVKGENGEEDKEIISKYIYFSEKAITDWLKKNPEGNPVDDMLDEAGTLIDVLGVVNNNFKEIFENNTNTEIINDIIKTAPNNVWVEDRGEAGKFLVYLDENKDKHEVSLENNETQTEIFKHTVGTDGEAAEGVVSEALEVKDLKKGDIYYSYKGENGKINYINMTSDVINSVQNSETLKQEIFNTVNNYTTDGGNVYYGEVEGENILYTVDKENNKTPIDISKDVQKVIEETVNNSIVEKILQQTEVKVVTDSVDVAVNSSIDGSLVYRGKRKIKVDHTDGYDVTFIGSITAKPSDKKEVVEGGTRTVTYQDSAATMETLLSANIIDVKTKQVVVSTVTDVSVSGNELTFYFGQNGMYMALDNGDYEVVFEYTASK